MSIENQYARSVEAEKETPYSICLDRDNRGWTISSYFSMTGTSSQVDGGGCWST